MEHTKIITGFAFILALFLSLSLVSADIKFSPTSISDTIAQGTADIAVSFSVNHTGVGGNYTDLVWTGESSQGSWTTLPTLDSLNESQLITVSATLSNIPSTFSGTINANITINDSTDGSPVETIPITITVTPTPSNNDPQNFCGTNYNDTMVELDVDDNELDNQDKWDWKPLDNIEIEVKLKNIDREEDYDYDVILYLYDGNTDASSDIVDDTDDLELTSWGIDSRDRETDLLEFQVDGQVEEGNYEVYAVVIRDDDQCYVEEIDDVKIDKKSRQIVVKDVILSNTAEAGETLEAEVEVANIGNKDEDRVKVLAFNNALGINAFVEIDNFDEGDQERVLIVFEIPEDAKEGLYKIRFATEYDYDEDDERYEEESDTDDDILKAVSVFENVVVREPGIAASLKSDPMVGEELKVEVTITNSGELTSFLMLAEDYSSWAKSLSIDPSTIAIAKDQSATVEITMTPTESGKQTFTLKSIYNGQTSEREIEVDVAEKSGFLTGAFAGVGTYGTWLIIGIIVLLVLILLILIIRIFTKKKPAKAESSVY